MNYIGTYDGEISSLRVKAHLHQFEAAELSGVSLKTFKKWEINNSAPVAVIELLKARAGCIWPNWSYRDGYLYDPNGRKFHEGMFMAAFYTLAAAEAKNIDFIHAKAQNLDSIKIERNKLTSMTNSNS